MTSHNMSIIITIIIPNIGTSPDYSPFIIGHIIPTIGTIIPMIFHDYPNSMNSIKIPIGYINRFIWLQFSMWGFMQINGVYIQLIMGVLEVD